MHARPFLLEDRAEDHAPPGVQRPAPGATNAVTAVLRLSLGWAVDSEGLDWVSAFAVALRERLAPLAWLRSGHAIRESAPPDVVDRWRTLAVSADRRGRERLALLSNVLEALSERGIAPVVLKGMPLSQRLYGDPFVRASDDIDLLVGAPDRRAARSALESLGWQVIDGAPPWDELFTLGAGSRVYLELHERLVTDYLAHLKLSPRESVDMTIEQVRLRAFAGVDEAAYLAAHLAGHQLPPLLWVVDFHSLWSTLGAADRARASERARVLGFERYLAWALDQASLMERAAHGDERSLVALGVRGADRVDAHLSILRHARLAARPLDAARTVAACLWPRPIRWDVPALASRFLTAMTYRRRGRSEAARQRRDTLARVAGGASGNRTGHGRSAIPDPQSGDVHDLPASGGDASRAGVSTQPVGISAMGGLKLSAKDVLTVVREVLTIAGSVNVRAAGMSMWPTIGDGSIVTLIPPPATVRPGQIVLMDWGGRPVLHRVVRIAGGMIHTTGDACIDPDPPTALDRVCALATSVSDSRGVITLTGSWKLGARSWLLFAGARARLGLARVWRRWKHRPRGADK